MIKSINTLEALEQELVDQDITIVQESMPTKAKGIYWSNEAERYILISNDVSTKAEHLCVLAEEAGHFYTSDGNILSLDDVMKRRQERRARGWAYERLVPPENLITAWRDGIRTFWETTEYLGVTGEFLAASLEYYKQKHWPVWHVDQYEITFEPFDIKKIGK
ncbi:MAG: ImmA/IrrE family metallo-endopeptidase [Bacillota bacterium]